MENKYVTFAHFWENDFNNLKLIKTGNCVSTKFRGCFNKKSLLFRLDFYPNGENGEESSEDDEFSSTACAYLFYVDGNFKTVKLKHDLHVLHNNKVIGSYEYTIETDYDRGGRGCWGKVCSFGVDSPNFFKNLAKVTLKSEIKIMSTTFFCSPTMWPLLVADTRIGGHMLNSVLDKNLRNKFADVTLIANDGQKFECHRNLLTIAAPAFFEKLFESGMSECATNEVHLSSMSSKVLTEILRFVYKNEILPTKVKSLTNEILNAAEMFQLESLKQYCTYVLIENVDWTNAIEMLITSDMFSLFELEEKSICIAVENYGKIQLTEEWVDLLKTNAALALKVVFHQAEKLNVITSQIIIVE